MSAKHKRPFYVFAVVAAICSLVLVTGLRGKAQSSPPELPATAPLSQTVNSAGVTLKKLARAVDARVLDTKFGGLLAGTGADPGPSPSGGTEHPEGTPSPDDGTDGEPPDPGSGEIEGGQTPTDSDPSETGDPADDGTTIDVRPQGDEETQSNVGNEDPDGDTDGDDTEGDEEETVGPEDDETGDPTDQGDGYDHQGDGQDVDGDGDRDVEQDQGEGVDPDLVEDPDADVDPDVVPDVARN